jgi:hypothetical protein
MSLYIQQLFKLIGNQLGRLYRHFGANSDGAAWFLICTSLISQHEVLEALTKITAGTERLNQRVGTVWMDGWMDEFIYVDPSLWAIYSTPLWF